MPYTFIFEMMDFTMSEPCTAVPKVKNSTKVSQKNKVFYCFASCS